MTGNPSNILAYKILLVDDNTDLAKVTGILLRLIGHEVHICHNGKEGLNILESNSFDVLLTDIDMPVMDGFETCAYLRGQTWGEHLPIVAVTAREFDPGDDSLWQAGFDAHWPKPVDYSQISKKIEILIAQKAGGI